MNAIRTALQAMRRELAGLAVYSEAEHSEATEKVRAAARVEPPVTDEDVAFADEMWECSDQPQNAFRRQSDSTPAAPDCHRSPSLRRLAS